VVLEAEAEEPKRGLLTEAHPALEAAAMARAEVAGRAAVKSNALLEAHLEALAIWPD
jgi:hypothetical protein